MENIKVYNNLDYIYMIFNRFDDVLKNILIDIDKNIDVRLKLFIDKEDENFTDDVYDEIKAYYADDFYYDEEDDEYYCNEVYHDNHVIQRYLHKDIEIIKNKIKENNLEFKLEYDVIKINIEDKIVYIIKQRNSGINVLVEINNKIEAKIIEDLVGDIIEHIINQIKKQLEYVFGENEEFEDEYLGCIEYYSEEYMKTSEYNKYYRDFIKPVIKATVENMISRNILVNHVMEDLNRISCTPYESSYAKGRLFVISDSTNIDENIKFSVRFKQRILLKDYKAARKVLQMSKGDYILITDSKYIYGISNQNDINKGHLSARIKFNGHYSYSIISNNDEILNFEYGYPVNKENQLNKERFENSIKSTFESIKDSSINRLFKICEKSIEQSKGTMIVISDNARLESRRLEIQSLLIEEKYIETEIISNISSIDGCILVDENAICYAVGVILDGKSNGIGNSTRGARYNSAIKYIDEQNNIFNNKCIAIIISEDGMIDIVDNSVVKQIKMKHKFSGKIYGSKTYPTDKNEVINLQNQYIKLDNKFTKVLESSTDDVIILLKHEFSNNTYGVYKQWEIKKSTKIIVTNEKENFPTWSEIYKSESKGIGVYYPDDKEEKQYQWKVCEGDVIVYLKKSEEKFILQNIIEFYSNALVTFNNQNIANVIQSIYQPNVYNSIIDENVKKHIKIRSQSLRWEI